MEVNIKKLHPDAIVPARATEGSSGYDLHALDVIAVSELGLMPCGYEDAIVHYDGVTVFPNERVLVRTGIAMSMDIPSMLRVLGVQVEAQVRPRSGHSLKNGIHVALGTIDYDYRSDVGVILTNNSNQPFTIKRGDRIAQLVFGLVLIPDLHVVDELDATVRGAGSYGHTGTKVLH